MKYESLSICLRAIVADNFLPINSFVHVLHFPVMVKIIIYLF